MILDDVLSGLDNSTEDHVFHSLLGKEGILREIQSTVLIVSSSGMFGRPPLVSRGPYAHHFPSQTSLLCGPYRLSRP